jgi:hypothetical protein
MVRIRLHGPLSLLAPPKYSSHVLLRHFNLSILCGCCAVESQSKRVHPAEARETSTDLSRERLNIVVCTYALGASDVSTPSTVSRGAIFSSALTDPQSASMRHECPWSLCWDCI